MLNLGHSLGLKTKCFGLGIAVSGIGFGFGLGLGNEFCGLVNNATRPPSLWVIICTIRVKN